MIYYTGTYKTDISFSLTVFENSKYVNCFSATINPTANFKSLVKSVAYNLMGTLPR